MRPAKVIAATLALLALGALAHAAPLLTQDAGGKAGAADLVETLKLLGSILTRHGSMVRGGAVTTFDVRDFRGCKITYELTPRVGPDHQGYMPSVERVTVDLAALDPALVKVGGGRTDRASVSFASGDGSPAVESRSAREPHHFGTALRLGSGHISLRGRASAEEAREALKRAIELCRQ